MHHDIHVQNNGSMTNKALLKGSYDMCVFFFFCFPFSLVCYVAVCACIRYYV